LFPDANVTVSVSVSTVISRRTPSILLYPVPKMLTYSPGTNVDASSSTAVTRLLVQLSVVMVAIAGEFRQWEVIRMRG
jgi:hypothetical protein